MDKLHKLGLTEGRNVVPALDQIAPVINLKLLASGLPRHQQVAIPEYFDLAGELVRKLREAGNAQLAVAQAARDAAAEAKAQRDQETTTEDTAEERDQEPEE